MRDDRLQEKRFTVPMFLASRRSWLAAAGVVLTVGVLLPPFETYARQYALAQALQFVIFAVAVPALLVAGAPRPTRAASGRPGQGSGRMAALADRRARASGHAAGDAVRPLLAFIALVVAWRLPAVVNTVVRDPGLTVAEMATLVAAGWGSGLSSLGRRRSSTISLVRCVPPWQRWPCGRSG